MQLGRAVAVERRPAPPDRGQRLEEVRGGEQRGVAGQQVRRVVVDERLGPRPGPERQQVAEVRGEVVEQDAERALLLGPLDPLVALLEAGPDARRPATAP